MISGLGKLKISRKIEQLSNWAWGTLGDIDGWEIEALGLTNPKKPSRLDLWFEFLAHDAPKITGDVAEFGIFRGASFVPSALILNEVAPQKTLYGFDSFSGFPEVEDSADSLKNFLVLAEEGKISEGHFEKVVRAQGIRAKTGRGDDFRTVSTSSDFSSTNRQVVDVRLAHFHLQNTRILEGYFEETINSIAGVALAGILLDSDLYEGYRLILNLLSDSVSQGGMVFLDEYFSLKFAGPKIAVDEYLRQNPRVWELHGFLEEATGFERFVLRKL